MKIILLVPKVVGNFISKFPETANPGYDYFNYDRRVYNERVDRGDLPSQYVGPDEFKDADYDELVANAKTLINGTLKNFDAHVAAEDALNMAIRDFQKGRFDGKINANKFQVLIQAMLGQEKLPIHPVMPVMAKSKPKALPKRIVRQLGLKKTDITRSRKPGGTTNLVPMPGGQIGLQTPEQRVASMFMQENN